MTTPSSSSAAAVGRTSRPTAATGPTSSPRRNGKTGGRPHTVSSWHRQSGFGYTLLAPQIIGYALFVAYPIVMIVRLSLYKINALTGAEEFVGLKNYERLVTDPSTPTILLNTGYLVVLLSITSTIFGLLLALLVNQKLPGINFYRAAIFIPTLVTMVAWTLVWRFIVQPKGVLDALFEALGSSGYPWLRSQWVTMTIIVIIQLLKNVGLYMMIFLAALQAVPQDLTEAARVDGASRWKTFYHVVLPQISPAVLMVFMLTVISAFKVFEVVYILTRGGPGVSTTVLSYAVYQAFATNNIGYSSALGVVLFLIVLVVTAVVWQFRKKVVFHEEH